MFFLYIYFLFLGNSSYQSISSNQQIAYYPWQSLVPLLTSATISPPPPSVPSVANLSPPRSAPPIPVTTNHSEPEPLETTDNSEYPIAEDDDDVFESDGPTATIEEAIPNLENPVPGPSSSNSPQKRRTQSLGAIQGKEPNSPLKVS